MTKTIFIGTRAYDCSMVEIIDDEGGFIGGVLIGLGGVVKGFAPAIGWNDYDLMIRLGDVQGVMISEV